MKDRSNVEANWDCVKFEGDVNSQSEQLTVFLKSVEDIGIDLFNFVDESSVATSLISVSFFRLIMPLCQDLGSISKFGDPSVPKETLHDLISVYIDLLASRLGSLDERHPNLGYEQDLLCLQLEFLRDNVAAVLIQNFMAASGGVEIGFEHEQNRITAICSTVNEPESDAMNVPPENQRRRGSPGPEISDV